MTGFVYAIQAVKGGPVKIGHSADPEARLGQLQTAHHSELKVVLAFPASPRIERELHLKLRDHLVRGEWYADCADVWDGLEAARLTELLNRRFHEAAVAAVASVDPLVWSREEIVAHFVRVGEEAADEILSVKDIVLERAA